MRNFARINNYYQREAALSDWLALAVFARRSDQFELVMKYQPRANAGVKTIDKAIGGLRSELETMGYTVPPNPSAGTAA